MKIIILIMLILLPVNLFAQGNDKLEKLIDENIVNGQNNLFVNPHKYFNESFFKNNPVDSTDNFKKSLKVGLYGSKLVPSSACQFQNSNGFSAKIIYEYSEWSSVSLDYIYIFNSVENKSTNTKASYFNEISINFRPYIERSEFGWFFNIGLNLFTYFNPNDGVYGDKAGALGIHAGSGFDYSISERISIEALARANLFLSIGFGRYYTIHLGLNYRITTF